MCCLVAGTASPGLRLLAQLPTRIRVTTLPGATHKGFTLYAVAGGAMALEGSRDVLREVQHGVPAREGTRHCDPAAPGVIWGYA